MADNAQATAPNSVQSKTNTSAASSSQPSTSQPVSSSTGIATTSHVDTKVRNAGASLAEFLTQLEDYTPTVGLNSFDISVVCVYFFTCHYLFSW